MVRQRMLTIPQSISLAKLWFQLLNVDGGGIRWTFWSIEEVRFWQLCGEDGFPPPLYKECCQPQGSIKMCSIVYV